MARDDESHYSPDAKRARASLDGEVAHTSSLSDTVDEFGRRMVNEYSVVGALGRGSFGEVSVVEHLCTRARFALKQMRRPKQKAALGLGPFAPPVGSGMSAHGATAASEPLYREVAVLKKLRHANVIRLYEVIDDATSDSFYLVMQLASEGQLMPARACVEPLSECEARIHFRSLLCALSHMHARGVTHGDLKPENFLLAQGRSLLVGDFGLARLWDGERSVHSAPRSGGTPAFCCPERVLGGLGDFASLVRADMWAAGGCLHMMLAGAPPFSAGSVAELLELIVHAEPAIGASVPTAARPLICGLLRKAPEERLTLAQAAQHRWLTHPTGGDGEGEGAAEPVWSLPAEDEAQARASAEPSAVEVSAAISPLDRFVSVVLLRTRFQAALRLQRVARGRLARRAAMGSLRTCRSAALYLQLHFKAKRSRGSGQVGAMLHSARSALFSLFWGCSRKARGPPSRILAEAGAMPSRSAPMKNLGPVPQ